MSQIIPTRNKPRRTIVGDGMTAQNSIRVYRQSPGDVLLQIRRSKDIVSVALMFEEAWQLVDLLIDTLPHREG
jgi:hypothetical protein